VYDEYEFIMSCRCSGMSMQFIFNIHRNLGSYIYTIYIYI